LENGKLKVINSIVLKFAPIYLSIDRQSKFLLVAYYTAGKAADYRINEKGDIE
jgi:6-phosphogluconolactonase (cycloisomerase 2 family)